MLASNPQRSSGSAECSLTRRVGLKIEQEQLPTVSLDRGCSVVINLRLGTKFNSKYIMYDCEVTDRV